MPDPINAAALPPPPPARHGPAWDAARALEANFLAEMLKSAGLGETPEGFGGGPGEEQFASFLRREQAEAMVRAGGIGLAETFYNSMLERE